MRPRVDLAEALSGQVRVELGGADASMAKERLNHSQVGSPLEQMGGEAVPKGMRRDAPIDPGHRGPVTHQAPDRFACQPRAPLADEDGRYGASTGPGLARARQVPMHPLARLLPHWHAS